ncbi:MAG: aldehyde ferredoxin oxidoreductase family protein [Isosphaeraceae bacterium]
MIYGYHGNYLLIDLTIGKINKKPIETDILRQYIGGVGLGSYILMQESQTGYDPLGPDAPLIFVTSPLVGTPLTTSAKFAIVAKSPLTGRICDAMSSSRFAIMAKKLGTDAICIKGRAHHYSILFLESFANKEIQMQSISADPFLGLSASETELRIHNEFGKKWQVSSTGLAAEKLIPFATISHDGRHAGRGGLGAVLGSKLIKAIAIYGENSFPLFDQSKTTEIARDLSERSLGPETAKYRETGTVSNLLVFNRLGVLPTQNFKYSESDSVQNLIPDQLEPARKIARNSCTSCTIGCEHIFQLKSEDTPGNPSQGVRLEYESLFALGPMCGIFDPDSVMQAARLCDDYGIDTISTGGTIAFLMDCVEKKRVDSKLSDQQTELHFGNTKAMISIIHEMLGDSPGLLACLLKQGSRQAAETIGCNSIAFANHVKGLEIPGYHPSRLHAMALGLAVGTRGADHNRSGAYEIDFSNHPTDESAIAASVAAREDYSAVIDSLILCKFLRGIFHDFYDEACMMLNAVTGFEITPQQLKDTGQRIVMLRRAFNQREGWQPVEDTLPENLFCSSENENSTLTRERFHNLLKSYYSVRDLTEDGFIRPQSFKKLCDSEAAPSLKASSD